jgi:catechol 2,3-dioxygenase-like lactoylglutathione lyase family enzyme
MTTTSPTTTTIGTGTSAEPRTGIDAGAPLRLSHLAYVTHDSEATVDFYTKVMRMPLVEAVMHSEVPSTGDPYPYVHFFFRMQDGSTIAFFEAIGLPERAEPSHAAYRTFDHLALEVASAAEVDAWAERLVSQGVEVLGPVDHKIIYSIYFHDPNGIRLEITTPLVPDWNDRPGQATRIVESFIGAKDQARATGRPAEDVLRDLIAAHDRRDHSA